MNRWLVVLGAGVLCMGAGCSDSDSAPEGMAGAGGGNAGSAGSNDVGGDSGEGSGGRAGSGAGTGGNKAGSGGSLSAGGGGDGGEPASDNAFEPDVPEEYVGQIVDPGLEVIAHTAREGVLGPEWLMAVKNTGTDYLCAIDVRYTFLDAADAELGSGSGLLDVGLVRGCNGTCGFTGCLGPGKVGMLVDQLGLTDVDVSQIAKVTHEFGALILTDAAPTDEIKVSGVQPVPAEFGGNVFSGMLENDSPDGVKNPSVAIYGLNAAGRPLFASEAIELVTIAAGSSWPFETSPRFEEPYVTYAAYAKVSDL